MSWGRRAPIGFAFCSPPTRAMPPRPLAKIASGGELSRVMLAVKQALANRDEVLTYVFDEVDAGIGGGTAEVIGRKLKRIAADRQVIVITHLPQVAAFADAHVRVAKTASRGKTRVEIEALAEAERTTELARMLGGAAPSAEAAAHADAMLRRSRQAAVPGKVSRRPHALGPSQPFRHRIGVRPRIVANSASWVRKLVPRSP